MLAKRSTQVLSCLRPLKRNLKVKNSTKMLVITSRTTRAVFLVGGVGEELEMFLACVDDDLHLSSIC